MRPRSSLRCTSRRSSGGSTPSGGILEPLDFISLAEKTGLIVPLGRWVLDEACRQTVEWQVRYNTLLRGSGLAPSHLVLELTESMLVHDNRATLERLHSLKSLGIRLSINDFGTGYSSLAYLERFPVDSLKMDRSFIAGLAGISHRARAPRGWFRAVSEGGSGGLGGPSRRPLSGGPDRQWPHPRK